MKLFWVRAYNKGAVNSLCELVVAQDVAEAVRIMAHLYPERDVYEMQAGTSADGYASAAAALEAWRSRGFRITHKFALPVVCPWCEAKENFVDTLLFGSLFRCLECGAEFCTDCGEFHPITIPCE